MKQYVSMAICSITESQALLFLLGLSVVCFFGGGWSRAHMVAVHLVSKILCSNLFMNFDFCSFTMWCEKT